MSTLNVNTISNAAGSGAPDFPNGVSVNSNPIPTAGSLSNRNLIINGTAQVAQRGTTATGITTVGYYTADRLRLSYSNSNAVVSQSVVANQDVGDFIANAIKNEITTASTSGGTTETGLNYRVEKSDILPHVGKTMTLSFYAKADAAVDIYPLITGDTNVILSTTTLTTSYVRYSFTFTVPAVSGVTFLDVILRADASVATAHYITGLQLEAGDVATPFEHRTYGHQLTLCQRYYFAVSSTNYGAVYGSNAMIHWYYPVVMRTTPTVSYTQIGGGSFSTNYVDEYKCHAYYTGDTTIAGQNFTADAEL